MGNAYEELMVSYGVRALLGGGKGQFIMEELRQDDPVAYKRVMAEAKRQYDELPAEYKSDRIRGLSQVMQGSLGSMAEMIQEKEQGD